MKSKILLTVMICMAAFSLSAQQDDNFDYGSIKDAVYTNSYFGITASFPSSWHVQNKDQMKKLTDQGADLIAGDDKSLKASIKASEVNTAYLLTIFKHEVGAPVDFNPSFMLIAENVKPYPGIKEGKDYLFHTRKIILQARVPYKVDENFEKTKINGTEFYVMKSSVVYNKLTVYQTYYCRIMKGFAVTIIISYASDTGNKEVQDILNKIKFEEK